MAKEGRGNVSIREVMVALAIIRRFADEDSHNRFRPLYALVDQAECVIEEALLKLDDEFSVKPVRDRQLEAGDGETGGAGDA